MDQYKIKATDYLTESLKLIVAIATILFGGLLAYRSNIETPISIWAYYASLALLELSSIVSVANINSLINKMYRGEEDAIKNNEVKTLNVASIVTLFTGIVFGAWFLSVQTQANSKAGSTNGTVISDSSITVGKEINSTVKVIKNKDGKISEVTISSK